MKKAVVVEAGVILSLTYHEKRLLTEAIVIAANERLRLSVVLGADDKAKAVADANALRRIEEDLWRR